MYTRFLFIVVLLFSSILAHANTIGNQSAHGYTAAMVDVYSLIDGKCEIRNNLGFNIEKDSAHVPTQNYIYNRQSPIATDVPDTSNNLYRRSFADLGLADTFNVYLEPSSFAIDKGMPLNTISDDLSRNRFNWWNV